MALNNLTAMMFVVNIALKLILARLMFTRPQLGLLLNRQFLLARLRRAFLRDSPTPGGSLRFAHRGLISFTPPACKPAARKGCEDISPGLSEAIPGVIATLYTDAR